MRWPSVPTPLPTRPGLVRWAGVSGATGYQVWYPDIEQGVLDTHERRRPARVLHPAQLVLVGDSGACAPCVASSARCRTAFRSSPTARGARPTRRRTRAMATGSCRRRSPISDAISDGKKQSAHELMPGLAFKGDQEQTASVVLALPRLRRRPTPTASTSSTRARSSVAQPSRRARPARSRWATSVGRRRSPTSASRTRSRTARRSPRSGRTTGARSSRTRSRRPRAAPRLASRPARSTSRRASSARASTSPTSTSRPRATTGRSSRSTWQVNVSDPDDTKFGWWDMETPQDACAAGRVESFGKESDPVMTGEAGKPFVSGLTPNGRLLVLGHAARRRSSRPRSSPGSRRPAPPPTRCSGRGRATRGAPRARRPTYSTSAVLNLEPGTWYYRVRGLNQTQLSKQEMTWSAPVKLMVVDQPELPPQPSSGRSMLSREHKVGARWSPDLVPRPRPRRRGRRDLARSLPRADLSSRRSPT